MLQMYSTLELLHTLGVLNYAQDRAREADAGVSLMYVTVQESKIVRYVALQTVLL